MKNLKIKLPCDPEITWSFIKKIEIRIPKRYLHSQVHYNTMHDIKEVETIYTYIEGSMNEENEIYIYIIYKPTFKNKKIIS